METKFWSPEDIKVIYNNYQADETSQNLIEQFKNKLKDLKVLYGLFLFPYAQIIFSKQDYEINLTLLDDEEGNEYISYYGNYQETLIPDFQFENNLKRMKINLKNTGVDFILKPTLKDPQRFQFVFTGKVQAVLDQANGAKITLSQLNEPTVCFNHSDYALFIYHIKNTYQPFCKLLIDELTSRYKKELKTITPNFDKRKIVIDFSDNWNNKEHNANRPKDFSLIYQIKLEKSQLPIKIDLTWTELHNGLFSSVSADFKSLILILQQLKNLDQQGLLRPFNNSGFLHLKVFEGASLNFRSNDMRWKSNNYWFLDPQQTIDYDEQLKFLNAYNDWMKPFDPFDPLKMERN